MVNTQFNCKIKSIRSDNGTKFYLKDLFQSHGILHQLTCVDTPQQNDVVERKHQHILNVARALRFQSQISSCFWGDCILTAVYLINRFPSRSLGNKSPYELLFNSPPSYNHLKCFGCLCFIYTLPHNRDKFAPRARKCVFLGYPHGIKGYKVLDLTSNSIHISRNIIFYEHIFHYALSSQPSNSYLDDMIFPHCTSDCSSHSIDIASLSSLPTSDPHLFVDPNSTPAVDTTSTSTVDIDVFLVADSVALPTPIPLAATTDILPSSISQSNHFSLPIDLIIDVSPSSLPTTPFPTLRRSSRSYKPPSYLFDYSCKSVSTKPSSGMAYDLLAYLDYSHLGPTFHSFVIAVNSSPSEPASFHQEILYPEWKAAMDKEIEALEVNNTWTLVPLPLGKCLIGCKWVYRVKYLLDGSIERYKARLVAKGFTQKFGLDYSETFSLVTKSISVRIVLSLVVVKGWFIHQFDVNNAFLHGDLVEDVYMCLPLGFHSKGENIVCKLNNSLYGLKQASRQWFDKFSKTILQMGFVQSKSDYSLFTHSQGFSFTVLLVYVDDILLT